MKKIVNFENNSLITLTILNIVSICLILLNTTFGFTHNKIINIMLVLFFIVLILLNVKYVDKSKTSVLKIFNYFMAVTLFLLLINLFVIMYLKWLKTPMILKNEYSIGNEKIEVYYSDISVPSLGPTEFIYVKNFILGIKCKSIIKIVPEGDAEYDLEKIYKELSNDKSFCKHKSKVK